MIPVMAKTNMDKLKIDLAGVDSGAKIFVRLEGAFGSVAAAVASDKNRKVHI